MVRYYEEAPRTDAATPTGGGDLSFLGVLKLQGVLGLLVVLFLVNFVGRSFTPILPLHLERLGVPASRLASATGVLICVYSIAAAFSATVLVRAFRRLEPRRLLAASLLCGAATVAPMAAVSSFPGFLVLAVLLGLASGGALTLCYTIGGLMVPAGVKTTAFGFFSGAALFGGAVSPTVAGFIARRQFFGIYWTDAALFALLAAFVFLGQRPAPAHPPVDA